MRLSRDLEQDQRRLRPRQRILLGFFVICVLPFASIQFQLSLSVFSEASTFSVSLPADGVDIFAPQYFFSRILSVDDTLATTNSPEQPKPWNPQKYNNMTNNYELHFARGLNLIRDDSMPRIAAWHFHLPRQRCPLPEEQRSKCFTTVEQANEKIVQNDTLFVEYYDKSITRFLTNVLPFLQTEVVLFTIAIPQWDPRIEDAHRIAKQIVDSPKILAWFCVDAGLNAGDYIRTHPHRVKSFPLGLKRDKYEAREQYRRPAQFFRPVFEQSHRQMPHEKSSFMFLSWLRTSTNSYREVIPRGVQRPYRKYLWEMTKGYYTLSPNGDHPDCHRHYEALGLGVVPITQLDRVTYGHLNNTDVVFNNTDWNVSSLEQKLPKYTKPVNRNPVFEEYWMEYVEQTVGRPLRWWDVVLSRQAVMDDFGFVNRDKALWKE